VIWDDYVVLGEGLARHPFEASKRSAVSRAYYGAFNRCRRWLETNVTPIDNRSAHQQVWETFKIADRASENTRSRWSQVGLLGGSLRSLRNQVDYDDSVPGLERHAPEAVITAERILALLDELEVAG